MNSTTDLQDSLAVLTSPFKNGDRESMCHIHRAVEPVHGDVHRSLTQGEQRLRDAIAFAADDERTRGRQSGFEKALGARGDFNGNKWGKSIGMLEEAGETCASKRHQRICASSGAYETRLEVWLEVYEDKFTGPCGVCDSENTALIRGSSQADRDDAWAGLNGMATLLLLGVESVAAELRSGFWSHFLTVKVRVVEFHGPGITLPSLSMSSIVTV